MFVFNNRNYSGLCAGHEICWSQGEFPLWEKSTELVGRYTITHRLITQWYSTSPCSVLCQWYNTPYFLFCLKKTYYTITCVSNNCNLHKSRDSSCQLLKLSRCQDTSIYHQLDLFQVVPSSPPWLHLHKANWSASYQFALM